MMLRELSQICMRISVCNNPALYVVVLCCLAASQLQAQEYLDADHRFMKLSERATDPNYGLSEKKPIELGSRVSMGHFLNALVAENGDRTQFIGLKELAEKKSGLVRITLKYQNHPDTIQMYFLFGVFKGAYVPRGFRAKTVADLPAGTKLAEEATNVSPCSSTVHRSAAHELEERFASAVVTSSVPLFNGGDEWLLQWFNNHPLNLTEDCTRAALHAHIAILVNCNSYGGAFESVGEESLAQSNCAKKLAEACRALPQQWKAAQVEGKNIDCYLMMDISLVEGKVVAVHLH